MPGKALMLWDAQVGTQPKVALVSTGSLSYEALLAARTLASEGIESIVLHMPSVKPLDEEALISAARRAGRVVTIEEHQIAGGFGSAVAECLSEKYPVPVLRLGLKDTFGQSGTPEELMEHYGLSSVHIASSASALIRNDSL
jgi:transketolase